MVNQTVPSRSQQLLIVGSIAFAVFMGALDIYIVSISLPAIAHHFNVGTSDAVHVLLAYLLVMTSTVPIFGKLGDKVGLKRLFSLGFCLFVIGSFLCGISLSLGMLVGSRCLQGIGGGMLSAVALAMIPRYVPKQHRGWAFGITSTAAGLGLVVGAPLGGFITEALRWNWIFLVNVPVGIAAIFFARRFIPSDETPAISMTKGRAFDVVGAVLSFFGLLFLVYALNRGQEAGWDSALTISLLVASVVLLISFIMWEKRCHDPLLDLSLFKIPGFFYGTLASLAAFAVGSGTFFLLPFYLVFVKKLSASTAGLVLMIYSVVYMAVSPFMGRLSDKVNPRVLCSSGMALATAVSIFFVFTLKLPGLLPVILYLLGMGLLYGIFVPSNSNLVMGVVPEERQGIASGVFRTMRNLGLVIGVALFETIFSLVIPRTALDTSLTRLTIPQDVLISGFRNSYIVGAFVCGLAFVLSCLARGESRPET
jgi:EmrB/QacA subfamily drug resistance transporter